MNRLTAIGLASLVAYGLLIASKYTGMVSAAREEPSPQPVREASVNAGEAPHVAHADPAPKTQVSFPAAVQRTNVSRTSAIALEFRTTRDLKAFADNLASRGEQLTSDERYHLAKALEECQFVASITEDLAAYSAKQRKEFLARLPVDDPLNTKRIAAYDAVDSSQRCLRFQNAKIAAKDIEDLYRAAAMQGDARAQGRMLVAELQKGLSTSRTVEPQTAPIDDFTRITTLLESKDP